MPLRSKLLGTLAGFAIAATAAVAPGVASAWAPANSAAITPGNMTFTDGAQCTSNFIFQGATDVYIGQAAHCSGTGAATDTNGCDSGSLPIGTRVEVDGASRPGTLAYNSWIEMQSDGETNPDACQYNDFALIKLDPADVAQVNPSIPGYGGPTALGPSTAMTGETVYSYGNSSLRGGVKQLRPKQGVVFQGEGNGWSRTVYTATPGVPGDSGSAFLSDAGEAIGVLSTLQIAPIPASNGVSDLRRSVQYMRSHNSQFADVELVNGTEPFTPDIVGAILGG
jgi:hypothetical protein